MITEDIDSKQHKAKINISSDFFLERIKDLSFCVDRNPTLPILKNIRIEIQEGVTTLTTSDLINTAQIRIEAVASGKCSICVPFDLLIKHLSTLANEELTLLFDLHTHTLKIFTQFGEYELPGEPTNLWPVPHQIENGSTLEVIATDLSATMRDALPFASTDPTRPVLNGINISLTSSEISICSLNGHAMCIRRINSVIKIQNSDQNKVSFTISPKIAKLLASFNLDDQTKPLQLMASNSVIKLEDLPHDFTVISQLIEEPYPDYVSLVPKENLNHIIIDRNILALALLRVEPFLDNDNKYVKIKLTEQNTLSLKGEDSQNSRHAWETIPAFYSGEEIEINFLLKNLKTAVGAWKCPKLRIELSRPNIAAIIRDSESTDQDPNIVLVVPVA